MPTKATSARSQSRSVTTSEKSRLRCPCFGGTVRTVDIVEPRRETGCPQASPQLCNHLVEGPLVEGPERGGADVAFRADVEQVGAQRLIVGRFHDRDHVVAAKGPIGLLQLHAEVLGRLDAAGQPLLGITDIDNALASPVHQDNIGGHDLLPMTHAGTRNPPPWEGVLITPRNKNQLDAAKPVVDLALGTVPGIAVTLLNAAHELVPPALDQLKVVIGQLAPLLLHLAGELFPVALDASSESSVVFSATAAGRLHPNNGLATRSFRTVALLQQSHCHNL